MKFERQVRRRMTKHGSKAMKHIEAQVAQLKPGDGTILPDGHIAIHHPEQGLLVLRADHVYVYTPVQESADPLDSILGKAAPEPAVVLASEEGDDDEGAEGAEPVASEKEKPLIGPEDLGGASKADQAEGRVTSGNSGYGKPQ